MLPEWLKTEDNYVPPKSGGIFITKTMTSIGRSMSHIKAQHGHEKKRALPAIIKLLLLFAFILTASITRNRMLIMALYSVLHLYLCTWPAKDIWSVIKGSMWSAILAFIIVLPAMIINPSGISNNIMLISKVFVSVEALNIFNHTTTWNHITASMKKMHIPGMFIFTLDITLKYIVLLGQLIFDILTSLKLRSVGKNSKEYQSIGGVMGTTFLKSVEMSSQMYDAMRCRGFTDDYEGL